MISHVDLHTVRPSARPPAIFAALETRFARANPLAPAAFRERSHRRRVTRAERRAERVERQIDEMIAAGDKIAKLPYVWGGGHGSFTSSGYDCSGSVSFVLHAAGLLSIPETSGALASFGVPGRGKHVTIYANGEHAWMTINGRRFDTIALQETGTRWSRAISSTAGYVAVHPRGM